MNQLEYSHPSLEADFRARDSREIARLVDSTLLKPVTTPSDVERLCAEAAAEGFRSVCIPPCHVTVAARAARGDALVCTVVGFPNGYNATDAKVAETRKAIADGAHEIDFVQNVGWVKAGLWHELAEESARIVEAAGGGGASGPSAPALVKVILETSLLTAEEISRCAQIHARSGVHVIKTSTGFGSRGASLEDVRFISEALAEVSRATGLCYGIKASGGVRGREEALAYLAAGVTRIGTSGGAALVHGNRGTAQGGAY